MSGDHTLGGSGEGCVQGRDKSVERNSNNTESQVMNLPESVYVTVGIVCVSPCVGGTTGLTLSVYRVIHGPGVDQWWSLLHISLTSPVLRSV